MEYESISNALNTFPNKVSNFNEKKFNQAEDIEEIDNSFLSFLQDISFNLCSVQNLEYLDEIENTRGRKASTANNYENISESENQFDEIVSERESGEGERTNTDEWNMTSNDIQLCRKLPTIIKTDHYKYLGETARGVRDGFGICYYNRGEVFIGQWKKDKKNGFGKFVLPSGEIHQGEIKNDNFEGYCEIINYKKNLNVKGFTKCNKFTGEIIVSFGETKIEGLVIENYTNDHLPQIHFKSPSICKVSHSLDKYYYGEINFNLLGYSSNNSLYGITMHKNTSFFIGEINRNTEPRGYGEYYYSDGSRFYGFFNNGKKNGLGVEIYNDGKIIFGNYSNDIKTGAFFYLLKGSSSMKMELYHFGFKSKTVEKNETIKKYLLLYYPEFAYILNFNYKNILDKLLELKEEDNLVNEILNCKKE